MLAAYCPLAASAQIIIFQENFESTTGTSLPSGWVVLSDKFGISTDNPLVNGIDTSNRVLAFSSPTTNEDTFSTVIDLSPYKGIPGQILLSFDFLSTATTDHAGLIGISQANADVPPGTRWVGGSPATIPGASPLYTFSGTGSWESISLDVTDYINSQSTSDLQTSYVAFERWNDATVASNTPVYFDNITISTIPEPGTYTLIFGSLCMMIARRRSKRQSL